jgi:two-component system, cell cycle sensor histidine kinase and response regulator CckA
MEGDILYINRAYCRVLGLSREEALGRNTLALGVWENSEIRSQWLAQLQREGHFDTAEILITSKGGERRRLEVSGSLIELDGKTTIIAAARDVTEHRLVERAAAASREQLLRVSELAHIGHFTIDGTTGEITWTAELFRIFGREPNAFKPTIDSVRACLHDADADAVEAAVDRAITTGQAQQLNLRVKRLSEEVRYCLTIVERGDIGSSGVHSVYGLVQDLTELRRAEENQRKLEQQVMQAQKLESLGVLAGGIAHDFNNLLTSILGNADLALSELSPMNPARTYLDDIETVTRRAADLCRQMLAYSGKGRFVVQPLSINDLVRDIAYLLTVSISKKVVVKYNFFPELPSVLADATQVRQIVMNLITNASEAIGELSGVVTLSTGVLDCDEAYFRGAVGDAEVHPEGQYVYLEVSDTGCGMDSDTLSRIFDPFFTTKFTGRGLGLAAVMGIVRGHKGALRVYSEKGSGTTFKVLLPSHRQPAQTLELGEGASREWRGQGTVLLVDDEESIRSMGRRLLERAGFEVLTASDGREAVELYIQHCEAVRLVVLDLTMPHLDGEACFRELRRADPRVKVIMTSGYNEQDVVDRFVGQGLAGFVQKPYKATDLLPKVREVLGE